MTQEWIKAIQLQKELYHPYFDEELKFLQESIPRGSIIDLGCGNGRIARDLEKMYTQYVGVDIDLETVNENNKSAQINQLYWQGDACKIPFDNETFDTSLCLTTYSNFGQNLDSMLKETSRVLKPKGLFIGSCYHEDALEKRLQVYEPFGDIIENIDSKGNVSFKEGIETKVSCQYTQYEVQRDLEKEGFNVESIQKSGPFYLFKGVKK